MQNLSQMTDVIDPLAAAAKSEPEKIGHRVCAGCILSCVGVTSDPNETIRKDIIYVAVQYHRFISIFFLPSIKLNNEYIMDTNCNSSNHRIL